MLLAVAFLVLEAGVLALFLIFPVAYIGAREKWPDYLTIVAALIVAGFILSR